MCQIHSLISHHFRALHSLFHQTLHLNWKWLSSFQDHTVGFSAISEHNAPSYLVFKLSLSSLVTCAWHKQPKTLKINDQQLDYFYQSLKGCFSWHSPCRTMIVKLYSCWQCFYQEFLGNLAASDNIENAVSTSVLFILSATLVVVITFLSSLMIAAFYLTSFTFKFYCLLHWRSYC